MAVIIQSNKACKNTIGHITGFKGPNDFCGMLDFDNSDFFTYLNNKKTNYKLTEAVKVSRSGSAFVIDENNQLKSVAANTPRITFNPNTQKYGLCGELRAENLFKNPTVPVTQNVTLTSSSTNELIMVTVYGVGSATVADNPRLTKVGSGIASDGAPAYFRRDTIDEITASIVISGSPSFVQVECKNNTISTPVEGIRNIEDVRLGQMFIDQLKSGEFTIIVNNQAYMQITPAPNGMATSTLVLESTAAEKGGLFVLRKEDQFGSIHANILYGVKKDATVPAKISQVLAEGIVGGNYGIGVDNKGNSALVSSKSFSMVNRPDLTPSLTYDVIKPMGGTAQLAGYGNSIFGGTCQYIVIYDRLLTDAELLTCV